MDDRDGLNAVKDTWEQLLRTHPARIHDLYDLCMGSVERLLGRPSTLDGFDDLDADRFISVFSAYGYLRPARREAAAELADRHTAHLELLQCALAHDDVRFTEAPSPTRTGTFADVAAAMLELYSWHTDFTDNSQGLRADAAALVGTYFRAFPGFDRFVVAGLLAHSRDRVHDTSQLLRFYLLDHPDSDGPMRSIALDLVGAHAKKGDPLHDDSPAIFTAVLCDCTQWPAGATSRFVDLFIRSPLRLESITQHEAAEKVRRSIEAQLKIADRKQRAGDTRADVDVSGHTRELELIETDFDTWQARRRHRALQRLTVSVGSRKALTVAAQPPPTLRLSRRFWTMSPSSANVRSGSRSAPRPITSSPTSD